MDNLHCFKYNGRTKIIQCVEKLTNTCFPFFIPLMKFFHYTCFRRYCIIVTWNGGRQIAIGRDCDDSCSLDEELLETTSTFLLTKDIKARARSLFARKDQIFESWPLSKITIIHTLVLINFNNSLVDTPYIRITFFIKRISLRIDGNFRAVIFCLQFYFTQSVIYSVSLFGMAFSAPDTIRYELLYSRFVNEI